MKSTYLQPRAGETESWGGHERGECELLDQNPMSTALLCPTTLLLSTVLSSEQLELLSYDPCFFSAESLTRS